MLSWFSYQKRKYVKPSTPVSSPNGTLLSFTRAKGHDKIVSPKHHKPTDHREGPGDTINRNNSRVSMIVQPSTKAGRSAIVLHADNKADNSSGNMYEVE